MVPDRYLRYPSSLDKALWKDSKTLQVMYGPKLQNSSSSMCAFCDTYPLWQSFDRQAWYLISPMMYSRHSQHGTSRD